MSVLNNGDVNNDSSATGTIFQDTYGDEFLIRDIDDKLQVLKTKKTYANELSKSKAKEMADLLLGIDTAEDKRSKGMKEINHIDYRIKDMLKKKDTIAEECKKQDEITEQLLNRKTKLDEFISTNITKSKEELVILENEIEDLKTKLSKNRTDIQPEVKDEDYPKLEVARQSNLKLLLYIEQQISSNESSLECPVCLEVASSPIFMCQEQHLLCGACRPRLQACPECRIHYTGYRRHSYKFLSSSLWSYFSSLSSLTLSSLCSSLSSSLPVSPSLPGMLRWPPRSSSSFTGRGTGCLDRRRLSPLAISVYAILFTKLLNARKKKLLYFPLFSTIKVDLKQPQVVFPKTVVGGQLHSFSFSTSKG